MALGTEHRSQKERQERATGELGVAGSLDRMSNGWGKMKIKTHFLIIKTHTEVQARCHVDLNNEGA